LSGVNNGDEVIVPAFSYVATANVVAYCGAKPVFVDVDSNTWIPKVNKDWSGAIPATLIYKNDKRAFYEKSFNLEELKTEVNKFLN